MGILDWPITKKIFMKFWTVPNRYAVLSSFGLLISLTRVELKAKVMG
jgi:hypothetical protein